MVLVQGFYCCVKEGIGFFFVIVYFWFWLGVLDYCYDFFFVVDVEVLVEDVLGFEGFIVMFGQGFGVYWEGLLLVVVVECVFVIVEFVWGQVGRSFDVIGMIDLIFGEDMFVIDYFVFEDELVEVVIVVQGCV